MNNLSKTEQFLSDLVINTKYSQYNKAEKRKNNWNEGVDKLQDMYTRKYPELTEEIIKNLQFIRDKKVLPSMRSFQFGGLPIEINPSRIYNCSYGPVNHPFFYAETMFLLLGGTGCGYSVRRHHVKQLPKISNPDGDRRFLIGDSIEGWADSIRQLVYAYTRNNPRPRFDYTDIRPEGSPIKKTGGTAPGPKKLRQAHINIEKVFKQAIGRRLTTLEASDIMCYMADCVLAGGQRDSAMITLFDIDDYDMMTSKGMFKVKNGKIIRTEDEGWVVQCELIEGQEMDINCYNNTNIQTFTISNKFGDYDLNAMLNDGVLPFYYLHPQRFRSNISVAALRDKTTKKDFLKIWEKCKNSGAGEPGIYWCNDIEEGSNPCVEISLKPFQFCNLTSINVFNLESQEDFNARARAASFIGTLQASFTDFHYLRPIWKQTTEADALLGVSMTGMASNEVFKYSMEEASQCVLEENEKTALKIGINPASKATCVKPEGTGTLAIGVQGNGAHGIHDNYYLRNNRLKKKNKVYGFLKEIMPDFIQDEFMNEDSVAVVSIPMKSPEGSILRHESSVEMLERIKKINIEWIRKGHRKGNTTHNVSATVSIRPNEWDEVAEWMWENKNYYNGLSCFPYSDHVYKQAPFQSITKEEYEKLYQLFPDNVNFDLIEEDEDNTNLVNELACAGGACLI